jgi:uncharacterized membrane protein
MGKVYQTSHIFFYVLTVSTVIDITNLDTQALFTLCGGANMGGSNSGGGRKYEPPAAYLLSTALLVGMLAFAFGLATAKYIRDTAAKTSAPTTQGFNV